MASDIPLIDLMTEDELKQDEPNTDELISTLSMEIDRMADRMDTIVKQKNELFTLSEIISQHKKTYESNARTIAKYKKRLERAVTLQSTLERSINKYSRKRGTLLISLRTQLAGPGSTEVAPIKSPLEAAFHAQTECVVCLTSVPGKSIVHLDNCTHNFCMQCVSNAKPQNKCMICRSPVNQLHIIVRCGERYKLKSEPVNYNFITNSRMQSTSQVSESSAEMNNSTAEMNYSSADTEEDNQIATAHSRRSRLPRRHMFIL